MRIIGYSIETVAETLIVIHDSNGRTFAADSIAELLDFIIEPCQDTLKVAWNLDAFVAPLLKLLGKDVCKSLAGSSHRVSFVVNDIGIGYSISFLIGKVLTVTRDRTKYHPRLSTTIYGLDGFFADEEPEPTTVELLAERGNELLGFLATLGIVPKGLASPISVFRDAGRFPDFSTLDNTPVACIGAQEYADRCTGKEWRENIQAGFWADGECFSYDLSCAYGSVAAGLFDIRGAEYIFSRDYVPGAYWGFLRGTVTIKDGVRVSPIMTRLGDGRLINPVGTWETYLTLDEIRFVERYGLGSFDLKDGWFLKFKHGVRPLNALIEQLYSLRSKSPPRMNHFLKRVPSGLVGKFHEHHDETGPGEYFNPIWHAIVTSTVRLKVAEIIYQHQAQDNLIRVNTDGFVVDKEISIPKGTGLGRWRFVSSEATIVLSPELVFAGDRHPNGMNYGLLIMLIARHPRSSRYQATLPKRVTLSEALRDHDMERLGTMTTRSSHIDLLLLGQNQNRCFRKFPRTGEALICEKFVSEPIRLKGNTNRKQA